MDAAKISIVLPSLNPSEKFDKVVDGLVEAGFKDIVIVDDGSREECKARFRRAEQYPQVHVLTHEVNRGKGAALKNAFRFILENRTESRGVVTIDGDGQHLVKDIEACAEAMTDKNAIVMGCRDFSGTDIPARSRMGNRFTCGVFRLCCGLKISDTQTGLRAIPRELLADMLVIRGDRFDYETNVLLEMSRRGVEFREVPITTVYEDGNGESHFRPIVDSIRIYRFILLYMLSSIAGVLVDLAVFRIMMLVLPRLHGRVLLTHGRMVLISTVVARASSSFLNFNLNNSVVFHGRGGYKKTMLRYYALAVPQMLISAGLVTVLSRGFGASIITTLIKAAVDTVLFFISFRIQQKWVFKS